MSGGLFRPVFSEHMCAIGDRQVHAVGTFAKGGDGERTACGMVAWRVAAWTAVNSDGEPLGAVAKPWPPKAATLPDDLTRCVDCHISTGRKSPACDWPEEAA